VLAGLREKLGSSVVEQLAELFRQNVSQRREALAAALEANDRPAAQMALHSIKGSAQIVGARRLEQIASKWEARARDGEIELSDEALVEIGEALRTVESALAAI
jgi:HPt (histidine-containing phosphotransfer) domain-containing protein